jgi:mono/diheme cytochrome c family protein
MRGNTWLATLCAAAAFVPGVRVEAAAPVVAASSGKVVYDQWCVGCHGPMAAGGRFPPAGTSILQQRYQNKVPAVLEERTDLKPEFIRVVVRQGVALMPALRKTEVTDVQLDALIAYLTPPKR